MMKLGLGAVVALSLAACAGSEPDASSFVSSTSANETQSASVHFTTSDWEPTWSGDIVPGGELKVDYDFERLTTCRNQGSVVSWVIEANYRFDGGTTHKMVLPGSPGAAEFNDTIAIPSDAKSVELWFENHAVGGYDHCDAFDSDYGANYTKTL